LTPHRVTVTEAPDAWIETIPTVETIVSAQLTPISPISSAYILYVHTAFQRNYTVVETMSKIIGRARENNGRNSAIRWIEAISTQRQWGERGKSCRKLWEIKGGTYSHLLFTLKRLRLSW
jgi:hypothetical protein